MLDRIGRQWGGWLFGGSCFLCRGAARALLCEPCDACLPRLGAATCPRCALDTPGGAVCGRCLAAPPHFDATVAALAYRFPADALVTSLKFGGELALAPLLGGLLSRRVAAVLPPPGTSSGERPDLVVPVPLSGRRLAERGFNQSVEIARRVAADLGLPMALDACLRGRDTPAQHGLALAARRANVRGAFDCPRLLAGAHVAVVDDVMTSGTTLDEVSAALKRAGAARVVNWVVARTPPPEES